MSAAAQLVEEALAAGLLLSRNGERIHIDSPTGAPLEEELCQRLLVAKGELLAYLERRERAIEIVAASFCRLTDTYPVGCPVAGPQWQVAEKAIDEAYADACESGDFAGLHAAAERYEQFALACFARSRGHEKGSRS